MPTINYVTHAEEVWDDELAGEEVESDVDLDLSAFTAEDDGLDGAPEAQEGAPEARKGGK